MWVVRFRFHDDHIVCGVNVKINGSYVMTAVPLNISGNENFVSLILPRTTTTGEKFSNLKYMYNKMNIKHTHSNTSSAERYYRSYDISRCACLILKRALNQ